MRGMSEENFRFAQLNRYEANPTNNRCRTSLSTS